MEAQEPFRLVVDQFMGKVRVCIICSDHSRIPTNLIVLDVVVLCLWGDH